MSFFKKVEHWQEVKRLKKLRQKVARFMEIYRQIKPRMEHLHSLLKYIDKILDEQEKAVKKIKGVKNGQKLR